MSACAVACAVEPPAESATLTSARYVASWDGVGEVIESDLGYRVHIDRGYLVSYRAQLVGCLAAQSDSETADPSATIPRVENLTAPVDRVLGEIEFDAAEYCRVHYLVARGTNTTSWLPDDVGMIGRTLYLEGRYVDPDGAEHSLAIDSALAYATLVELGDLEQLAPGEAGTAGGVEVELTRRWDRWFDGVDLVAMDADDVALSLLANLIDHTEIRLSFSSGDVP